MASTTSRKAGHETPANVLGPPSERAQYVTRSPHCAAKDPAQGYMACMLSVFWNALPFGRRKDYNAEIPITFFTRLDYKYNLIFQSGHRKSSQMFMSCSVSDLYFPVVSASPTGTCAYLIFISVQ